MAGIQPPAPSSPPVTAPQAGTGQDRGRFRLRATHAVGLAACVALIPAAAMPWATVGGLSTAGTEGDGVLTLLAALVCAALLLLSGRSQGLGLPVAVVVVALLTVVVCVVDVVDIATTDDALFAPSVGLGLTLSVIAAMVLLAAALGELVRRAGGARQPAS